MKSSTVILCLLLLISVSYNIFLLNYPKIEEVEVLEYIEKTDTVVKHIYHYDTIRPPQKIIYQEKIINDTVYIADTPKNYNFEDEKYSLNINATKLYDYSLDIHLTDTIPVYHTKVVREIVKKTPRITHGIQIGAGYGVFNKKPDLYIGYGVQVNF